MRNRWPRRGSRAAPLAYGNLEEAREHVERLKEAVQLSHEALMEAEQTYKDCVASLSALEATCRELGQDLEPPRSEDNWEDASLTPPSGISV